MLRHSPVIKAIAQLYANSKAGRTGQGSLDFQPELKVVLSQAKSTDGDARAQALIDLAEAEATDLIQLERHRRDPDIILKVRLPLGNEARLFECIGEPAPAARRQLLAQQFKNATALDVPDEWRSGWTAFCQRLERAAACGENISPFSRDALDENTELLTVLSKILGWRGESLVRFVSCVICQNSKRLEELAMIEREGEFGGKLRGKLGRLLEQITGGQIRTLDDLAILPNPRSALAHGPLKLCLDGDWLDFARLHGAYRIAASDIERAESAITSAKRCLTVENETSFHELAKLRSGELLIQTSFPGSGTLKLLQRLPADMEFWHFGDSDDAGFEILRVLRQKSGRDFKPLLMQRGRIPFEQESLGRPQLPSWPFYLAETELPGTANGQA